MPRVSHHFVVDRPLAAVFDIVTTARFWPRWHPATRGVEGDVDEPARLGDKIIEHVTIAGIEGTGTPASIGSSRASAASPLRPAAAPFTGRHRDV